MARQKSSKFSFPIPGRKSHAKGDHGDSNTNSKTKALRPMASMSSMPSLREHPPYHYDDTPSQNISKAQRILGTAGAPFRPSSKQTNHLPPPPPSPGYMSITISDVASDYDRRTDDDAFLSPRRPNQSNRASSNILPPPSIMAYNASDRPNSVSSTVSRHLRLRASDSTMRSHYDARSSPLSISQQTSDSAVRDMALRKGKPQVVPANDDLYTRSPLAHQFSREAREPKRSKPPRLDLSKLFPKPRSSTIQPYGANLLSPTKMVSSPSAMSNMSEHFPRPMIREPTPQPMGHTRLTKSKPQHSVSDPTTHPGRSMSPSRLYRRDQYDHAKINVRRPPQGIKHWFDGLDEESDEADEPDRAPLHAPAPVPQRKSSLGYLLQECETPRAYQLQSNQSSRVSHHMPDTRRGQSAQTHASKGSRVRSSSQYSLQSQTSQTTSKTKESALSKSNLLDSSVLSFSSSEDEEESINTRMKKIPVRDSIDINEDQGDIVIGQAQALAMRPSANRRPSVGKLSMMSTSTNAATIEVMYSPEPYVPQHFPRFSVSSSSKRSSHLRQPSIIREGDSEDPRPKTANVPPISPTTHSVRTSTSEPSSRVEAQKFMAVTPEEEALLAALRKKRAAMAQQSWVEGYATAIKHEDVIRQITPPESKQKAHRTSAFLSLESPGDSPVRVVETKKPSRKSLAPIQTPSVTPSVAGPSRGRSVQSKYAISGSSVLRDSSSCDPASERHVYIDEAKLARRLSPQPEFSPLDPFPSPTRTVSISSPITLDHPSPLPSPITPGLRIGESDLRVKVASSEPSCNSDNDEVAVLETGVIDAPPGSMKSDDTKISASHHRRRTTSSRTDAPIPILPKLNTKISPELVPVSEASSRTSSMMESTHPKVPKKSSLRQSAISPTSTGLSSSRHNSITSMRTASPNRNTYERRSRAVSRVSSMGSMKRSSITTGDTNSTRCSVSDDVLAAWGSLGGNYERPRY